MRRLIGLSGMFAVALAAMLATPNGALGQVSSGASAEEQLAVDYSFDRPEISEVTIAGELYHRVTMPGVPNCGNSGEPALPASGARILLPLGMEVSGIKVVPSEGVLLGSDYYIEPTSRPVRLSAEPGTAGPPSPDPVIYAMDTPFPGAYFEEISTYGFRGYRILIVKLHPVRYIPTSGELYYYPNLTVVVDTVDTGKTPALYRGLAKDRRAVLSKVDNPDLVATYPETVERGDRGYDLLIITQNFLRDAFTPLKTYHDAHGISTEIHTVSEAGGSGPTPVRNYIIDCYLNHGIEYVIIGADDNWMQARDLYVESWPGGYVETDMPGDVYFGCLDGTWNYDGDSYWGEPTDGDGGGDVDLMAEVYVGRASVYDTVETGRFVDKTIWYLGGGHTQTDKVLLVGEHLGFGGVSEYAADMMEQLIDGSSADGYTTVGIPSSEYAVDELFERDMSWSQSTLRNRIDAGVHILNHLGHGSETSAMKFSALDLLTLNNTDLCFVYSQTCLAGHFDGTDCWAEYMNIKADNGGFAVIMNARYGWGTEYSTDGPSQRFNREFWDAVFDEGKGRLGCANHDSKEDNLYRINQECMRWCYYELNLFGDPSALVQGMNFMSFTFPSGLPEALAPGTPEVIDVEIVGTGESVVSGSPTLHYRYDGGSFLTSTMTHISGDLYRATLPAASCGDTPEYYFSAEGTVSGVVYDPAGAPTATYSVPVGEFTTVFSDNFETDQGWVAENLGASSGDWQRGVPVNDPGWDYDPASDSDGSGQCYLTQNQTGNTDVDGGAVRLTSPAIDMSGGDVTISYDYYLYLTDTDGTDRLLVEINNNGGVGTWIEIARHDTDGGLSWRSHAIDQDDLDTAGVTLTANMKIRFTTNDGDSQSINESGLDAFEVAGVSCVEEEYTLTVSTVGDGSVTKDPDQATYTYDQDVDLTAVADLGWTFDHWSGDLTGSTNPDTITITDDMSVTAHFVEDSCPNPGATGFYCAADVYPNNGDGSWNYADDGDCIIDMGDLGELLPNYGTTSGMTREDGDVYPTGAPDGAVDMSDLGELLAQYGDNCN